MSSDTQTAPRPGPTGAIPAKKATPPVDGVELLVEMTRTGEIDPWNIDIVKVADQYLKVVTELREADLKVTGKTLLYLAILLRMKSDQLAGIHYLNPPEEDEFLDALLEPDFMSDGRAVRPKLSFRSLDEVIKRRTSAKQPRIRPVTLEDLLQELRKYEELEKRRSLTEKVEKVNKRRMMNYADLTADDIEEMAHEEFHEETVGHLQAVLAPLLASGGEVTLSEAMAAVRLDRVSTFIGLLFLAARGGIHLRQDTFYSEVYIASDDAPADHEGIAETRPEEQAG